MTKRFKYIVRRIVPMVSTGLLFQASGCSLDTNALLGNLASTIANQFIQSYVFGAFGVGAP